MEPGLDLGLIALCRPHFWLLDALIKGAQEAIDVGGVIADPEGALDHRGHPRRGPDVAVEPVGFGAFAHVDSVLTLALPQEVGQTGRQARVSAS